MSTSTPRRRIGNLTTTTLTVTAVAAVLSGTVLSGSATAVGHVPSRGALTAQPAAQSTTNHVEKLTGDCTRTVAYNGVRVRTQPDTHSTAVAQVNRGARLIGWNCLNEVGGYYSGCGGSQNFWAIIRWNGTRRYVAGNCVRPTG